MARRNVMAAFYAGTPTERRRKRWPVPLRMLFLVIAALSCWALILFAIRMI
jgi:hypothetical protein